MAVVDQLLGKTRYLLSGSQYSSLGLSGGVANNNSLRSSFDELAKRYSIPCLIAHPHHTGDNAAMIAFAASIDPSGCILDLPDAPLSILPSLQLA